ncbi:MAG: FliA/WhiG family RNA polymerase sigma factor [Candidatus Sericytochromatia bacterium]|uniref:FliA/WhiG family RNA polymerase sigma factor n=1 Tax=Candidatus Tanganyikabacteria bacterium TaxID=2961651 RepID=A0A937X3S1_9BACT|nr:FliA/WhiG family RNA polymerase sigma factor [Candidatus Tanganyikabacteria bacterium]
MAGDTAELWQQFTATGDKKIREKLILQYAPLVRYVVGRLAVTLPPTIDQEDLYGYGLIGLIQAVEKFTLDRGVKFETYAITRIRGAILDELRSQDWVPRSVRSRTRDVSQAMQALEAELGRPATEEELANRLGLSASDLANIMSQETSPFLSLDELVQVSDDGQSITWLDTMADERPGPAAQLEEQEFRDQLAKAIDALPEREKVLLALYYQEGLTLKEIGMVLKVSESRVCQLHTQAALRLRTWINRYLGIETTAGKARTARTGT